MRRQKTWVGRGEVPQAEKRPPHVSRSQSRKRREKVSRVAPDAPNARHRLQMTGIDGDTHRS